MAPSALTAEELTALVGPVSRLRRCPEEFLVAFSCKGRVLCPSCGARRAAELAAFLADEVVEDLGHARWVFTVPKMLRVYVLHHRELLGELARGAYETVKELMAAAAGEEKGFRPGVVSVAPAPREDRAVDRKRRAPSDVACPHRP